jgi:DNA-directed RNA polymerase specialized sigma24 family protein
VPNQNRDRRRRKWGQDILSELNSKKNPLLALRHKSEQGRLEEALKELPEDRREVVLARIRDQVAEKTKVKK